MSQSKPRPATCADLEVVPPHLVGEINFGVLHVHPLPTSRHGIAATLLHGEVSYPFWNGSSGPVRWRTERLTELPKPAEETP